MTPAGNAAILAADVDGLRLLVAGLAAELAAVAGEAVRVREEVYALDQFAEVIRAVRREGYREGLGTHDGRQADANARERRAQFRVIAGGRAAPKACNATVKAAPKARTRKAPGGAR